MHQTGSVRGARPLTGPQAAMRARQIWPRGSSSVLRSAGGEFLLSASFADQIGTGDRRQHEKPIRQRLRYRNPCMWMGNSGAAARARARKNAAARAPAAPAQKNGGAACCSCSCCCAVHDGPANPSRPCRQEQQQQQAHGVAHTRTACAKRSGSASRGWERSSSSTHRWRRTDPTKVRRTKGARHPFLTPPILPSPPHAP